jgi:hypothetical protein
MGAHARPSLDVPDLRYQLDVYHIRLATMVAGRKATRANLLCDEFGSNEQQMQST